MSRPLLRLLLAASCLLAGGCVLMARPVDPRPADVIVAQAEELVDRRAYAQAAELYAAAIVKQPDNGSYYLRRSELLEAIGHDKEARVTYREALPRLAKGSSERIEVIYRLALISAEHMHDMELAEELLMQLPTGSLQRLDLTGYFYFLTNQHEESIPIFNQALVVARTGDQKASVLYHAAQVYDALKDEKNAVTSLYLAINNATHLGLIRDISALWTRVSGNQVLPNPPDGAQSP
ncbi:MAG: tetratricopeptide repeat protein [Deltaproteobacteria bacterium]|nr:MAG: tetratricopeptide repeat protein [Deltaproteobacteria bacterium]